MAAPVAIRGVGLVTSVGSTSRECCAAFRAKVSNPTATRYLDATGASIVCHQIQLDEPLAMLPKLAMMAAKAIDEALGRTASMRTHEIPLLLCVAEEDRPGRTAGLDSGLLKLVEERLGVRFSPQSAVVAQGRVGVAVALSRARELIADGSASQVVLAATDSLVTWPTLSHYQAQGRLLNDLNSDGLIPGEGAGALLVGARRDGFSDPVCAGIGFGWESATIGTDQPLRGDGLAQAVEAALEDAQCSFEDIDYRITDNSGEHYFFKESALVILRSMRVRKSSLDVWNPAECTGEIGAVAGISIAASAVWASRKNYSRGAHVLAHMAGDGPRRASLVLRFSPSA